jgi:hypothetical protein
MEIPPPPIKENEIPSPPVEAKKPQVVMMEQPRSAVVPLLLGIFLIISLVGILVFEGKKEIDTNTQEIAPSVPDGGAFIAPASQQVAPSQANMDQKPSCNVDNDCNDYARVFASRLHMTTGVIGKCMGGQCEIAPVSANVSAQQFNQTCVDSDPNNDIYKKGNVVFTTADGRTTTEYDRCTDDYKEVIEKKCNKPPFVKDEAIAYGQVFTCPNGCQDGACIHDSQF